MAKRKDEARVNLLVGAFVTTMFGLLVFSMFIIATSEGLLEAKADIYADFRTVTGLTRNSPVQLAGTKIGVVKEIGFASPSYPCSPTTEDLGRFGSGRTDDCDASLFCAAEAVCAELEMYTGLDRNYEPCTAEDGCRESEMCVTKLFTRRYRRVKWTGPEGVCVPYQTSHQRVRVTLEVSEEKLIHIRDDSRATITANGVLGDQLINITVGKGEPIADGGTIQATPSLMEELLFFKDRFEGITEDLDRSLAGVAGLFDALNDDRTKGDLKGVLANANEISRQVAEGDGLVGALFNDPEYKAEFSKTLRHVRHGVQEVDGALTSMGREVTPAVRDVRGTLRRVNKTLETINDPENKAVVSRLLHDDALGEEVAEAITAASDALVVGKQTLVEVETVVAEVRTSLASGEGTLGKLLKDPKAYDDLVKVLGNIERNNVIKKLVRFVVEQDEASSSAAPTAATTPPAAGAPVSASAE